MGFRVATRMRPRDGWGGLGGIREQDLSLYVNGAKVGLSSVFF